MKKLFFGSHEAGRLSACTAVIVLTLAAMGAAPASKRDIPRARLRPATAVDPQIRELIPAAPELHPAFTGDKRLSGPVTLALGDAPMSHLLTVLSRISGVSLTATPDVADDEVTVGFKHRPLGEVLTLLSTHFGFTWREDHGGYKLWQDLASRKREEGLRQRDLKTLVDDLVRVAPLARLPAEEIKARTERLEQLIRQRDLNSEQRGARADELNDVYRVGKPASRLALQILGLAPRERIRNLLVRGRETFSTSTGDIGREMVERWWLEQRADGAAGADIGDSPRDLTVRFRLEPGSESSTGQSMLHVRIEPAGVAAVPATQFFFQERFRSGPALVYLRDSRLSQRAPASQPEQRPAVGFTSGPYLAPWQDSLNRRPSKGGRISDFLLLLHRDTGLDVLSDSLAMNSPFGPIARPGVPYGETLWPEARRQKLALALDAGVLRVRHSQFYNLRPRQIPARRMEQAIAELEPDAEKMLATMTRLVADLTPGQRVTLAGSWSRVWANNRIFAPSHFAYRAHVDFVLPLFLARISGGVQSRLLGGEPVKLATLSPEDRSVLDDALDALSEAGYDRPPYSPPPGSAGSPATLLLKKTPGSMTVYRRYGQDGRPGGMHMIGGPAGRAAPVPVVNAGEPSPTLIGEPYPHVRFSLELQDEEGRLTRNGGSLSLIPPALFPPRPAAP